MSNRKPDYRIAALNKRTDAKNGNIGGAWANPDGSISVRFEAFVVLEFGPDLVVTLFPTKGSQK